MVILTEDLLSATDTEVGSTDALTGSATVFDHQETHQEDKTGTEMMTLHCYHVKIDYGLFLCPFFLFLMFWL